MELIKTTTVKRASHGKLTKKQREALKARKWLVFERSWKNVSERINYMKAVCRTNAELHKCTLNRLYKLHETIMQAMGDELKEMGVMGRQYSNISICQPKYRSIKMSIEK